MSKIKLSAIIACYRDELSIPIMYQRLTKIFNLEKIDYEIIFVNDCSPDNSAAIIHDLVKRDRKVIGITHTRNFGSQIAFTSGMEIATGDAVILFDGDQQDPPELIPQLINQWQQGYDVVYGIRVNRQASLLMNLAYKVFYRIFHRLSYIKIPVDAGDFSLIDRRVVESLKQFPERDRFLRGLRAWVGFKQIGVEYTRPERMFGVSTNNLIKNFHWATKGIFSFSFVPLQWITLISLITFMLLVIGIIIQVTLKFIYPDTPRGVTTLIVLILFLGSVQLLSLSIIGEYIAKIFEETKRRPLFIVDNIDRIGITHRKPAR